MTKINSPHYKNRNIQKKIEEEQEREMFGLYPTSQLLAKDQPCVSQKDCIFYRICVLCNVRIIAPCQPEVQTLIEFEQFIDLFFKADKL